MSEPDFDSFNDPALRSAVRRVWGDEQASAELREKLQAMFPRPSRSRFNSRSTEPMSMRIRSALYGLAAAAVFVFAVGLAFQDWVTNPRNARIAPRTLLLPTAVADDLVSRHDFLRNSKNMNLLGGQVETADARSQLQDKLGFPVLAMEIAGTAWKYRGAAFSSINGVKSGQMLFETDDKKFVSVFSMPPSLVSGSAPACEYAQVNTNHPLAGFASNKALYCLVASSKDGSLTLDDIRSIRDGLRPMHGAPADTVAVVMAP